MLAKLCAVLVNFGFSKNQHMDPRFPRDGDVRKQKIVDFVHTVLVCAESESAQSILDFHKFNFLTTHRVTVPKANSDFFPWKEM